MRYPHGTCTWHRGQSEEHLHGFATVEDRDAFDRGESGPFERVLRDPAAPPIDDEVRLARALCGGHVQATIEHLRATGELPGEPEHCYGHGAPDGCLDGLCDGPEECACDCSMCRPREVVRS